MLAAIPLLAVCVVDAAAVLGRHSGETSHRPAPSPTASGAPQHALVSDAIRNAAIRELLTRRGDAVMTHDAAEWRATLDPDDPRFMQAQMKVFSNLRQVPFASWSYSMDPSRSMRSPRARMYDAPTWAPAQLFLNYRLRGFDPRATSLPQYPTFVRRGSAWFLASLDDFTRRGDVSSTDLWDYGPVTVVRTHSVLVLGHPSALGMMRTLAEDVASDIPRVTAVWGDNWSQRAVLLVPSTQHELGEVVQDYGQLDHIAAVATAEVQIGSGRPDPVGDRIGINPANWSKLSALGQRIVLTHELTHVATRAVTSAAMPTWLAEGFADYVGYLGSGVPTSFVAQELGAAVRSGRVPRSLPTTSEFNGASKRLSQAYEGAWLACRMIAQRWGQRALVRFYASVGRSDLAPAAAVQLAMHRLLHLDQASFVQQWRGFLRSELG